VTIRIKAFLLDVPSAKDVICLVNGRIITVSKNNWTEYARVSTRWSHGLISAKADAAFQKEKGMLLALQTFLLIADVGWGGLRIPA
jgi:hypothetical protein